MGGTKIKNKKTPAVVYHDIEPIVWLTSKLLKRSISQVRVPPKGCFLVQYIDAESCYAVLVVVVVV